MKELFDLLDQKERKILGVLCLLLAAVLLFYFFVSSGVKGKFIESSVSLSRLTKDIEKISLSRAQKEREWQKWEEARHDLEGMKAKYFYSKDEGINQLRRDVQQIFDEIRIQVSQMRYDYAEFEEENIKKVKVIFEITGSYLSLKNFIHAVEKFPKFLAIERIEFLNIDTQSGGVKLRFALAGYYES